MTHPPFERWPFRAKLVTPEAMRLAALRSITVDLDRVIAFCERLQTLSLDRDENGAPNDDVQFDALWTSALVAYARCFAKGKRTLALTSEDARSAGSFEWHESFMGLRDEHVAH